MAVVQNLYQIFKLPASFLVENNCDIKRYTISQGLKEGNIVSIGDNIIFQQLRYIHDDYRSHEQLFKYIQKLRSNMHAYKKNGQYKEASILNQRIIDVLFVKDIINVIIDKKKSDFDKFRTKGFTVNGIRYVYLCSGSGQIRRNTATFINERYASKIIETINCGLDKKTSEFVLAKYSAYFALAFSSVLWVRTPRVCVIKDFFHVIEDEPVDFICKNEEGKSIIEKRRLQLDLNCADGQGLIDPEFAIKWGEDMHLTYTPCSFVARSCFIKGNLVTFDFKEYAHTHGITTIRDRWGKEYNIDDIDVLISESQFKTYKYYASWDEYLSYMEKGNIHWGVARYNKRADEEFVLANYQYIQALTLDDSDIKELIQPTVEWINKICSGDPLYALLYSFGAGMSNPGYSGLYSRAQTNAMKAVVKNIDFLNDTYVQKKIYKNITESINHAKIGKIWIRGNYQFMIADPVAQCQAALGLETTGVLGKDEVYSNFWRERFLKERGPEISTSDCLVDACRSPMIDQHEHNPMNVVINNSEADYWFKHLPSGIIYNTWDSSCARHEDSDFDGDICLTTDNKYFLKGSHKDHNIITYEKGLAKPAKMTTANITKTVSKGFGTGVGGFSNTATCLYAMAAIFEKPGHEDQHQEILTRIKLLREIVGQEIDRIKGADKPSLPSAWKKFERILPTDDQETITRKMKNNAMVVSKKPYFFRYLYPELNQRFKQFEASYNQVSQDMFGIKFKKLLKKPDKTDEEQMLVRRYQKYSPLITSPCTMNRLCRELEAVDFDIQFDKITTPAGTTKKRKPTTLLPSFDDKFAATFEQHKFDTVKKMYQDYTSRKQIKYLTAVLDEYSQESTANATAYSELRSTVYDMMIEDLQARLVSSAISGQEFLFYCHRIAKDYSSFNWAFAWYVLDDQIVTLIPHGKSFCPVQITPDITISTTDIPKEYLGGYYILEDVTDQQQQQIAVDAALTDARDAAPFEFADGDDLLSKIQWDDATNNKEEGGIEE